MIVSLIAIAIAVMKFTFLSSFSKSLSLSIIAKFLSLSEPLNQRFVRTPGKLLRTGIQIPESSAIHISFKFV